MKQFSAKIKKLSDWKGTWYLKQINSIKIQFNKFMLQNNSITPK